MSSRIFQKELAEKLQDGTLTTFMEVVDWVILNMKFLDFKPKKSDYPGLEVCPHDDSFHEWSSKFSKSTNLTEATVFDVANMIINKSRQTHSRFLLSNTTKATCESLDVFAKQLNVSPKQVNLKVYNLLCNLRSVNDAVLCPLFITGTTCSIMKYYLLAVKTSKTQPFCLKMIRKNILYLTERERQLPTVKKMMEIDDDVVQGFISLFCEATRNKTYLFEVSPIGDFRFIGMEEQKLDPNLNREFDEASQKYDEHVATTQQKTKNTMLTRLWHTKRSKRRYIRPNRKHAGSNAQRPSKQNKTKRSQPTPNPDPHIAHPNRMQSNTLTRLPKQNESPLRKKVVRR